MKWLVRRIIAALVIVILTFLAFEAALAWVDPLGAFRYYADSRALQEVYQFDSARGYVIPPGQYPMARWSFSIDADGGRHVPASNESAACHVVTLGDSVTFGMGVNDEQAWPNLYAQATGCHVSAYALPGWNATSVLAAKRAAPDADLYVWLLVNNDHMALPELQPLPALTATRVYIAYANLTVSETEPGGNVDPAFWATYDALVADPRLVVYGFADGGLAQLVAATGRHIELLPMVTTRLSWADPHPDPSGHYEIAQQIAARQALPRD